MGESQERHLREREERREGAWVEVPGLPCGTLESFKPKSVSGNPCLLGRPVSASLPHSAAGLGSLVTYQRGEFSHLPQLLIRFHILSSCKHNLKLKFRCFKKERLDLQSQSVN